METSMDMDYGNVYGYGLSDILFISSLHILPSYTLAMQRDRERNSGPYIHGGSRDHVYIRGKGTCDSKFIPCMVLLTVSGRRLFPVNFSFFFERIQLGQESWMLFRL
jgi:hypothetical protein